jgi:hypothetical protein
MSWGLDTPEGGFAMAQFFFEGREVSGKLHVGACSDREAVDRIHGSKRWESFTAQTFDSMSCAERVRAWCALGWEYQIEPAGIQLAIFGAAEPMLAVTYRGTRILVSQCDLDAVRARYQDVFRFDSAV